MNEPMNLSNMVDPAILILGRNCSLEYRETTEWKPGLYRSLERDVVYLFGRREPQDSRLVARTSDSSSVLDLTEYNPMADTNPFEGSRYGSGSSPRVKHFTLISGVPRVPLSWAN
jgi:hypothetical protein